MRRFLSIFSCLVLVCAVFAQSPDDDYLKKKKHGKTVTGGGGSAPTFVGAVSCVTNFSVGPFTCNVGTVNTGDILVYHGSSHYQAGSDTMTVTDNCNTGGTSDTNVVDKGPTNFATHGTDQEGHFVVGLGRASCTVSFTFANGTFGTAGVLAIRGSSGLDVIVSAFNQQLSAGTGTDAITSNAVTATTNDICIGATSDEADVAGTFTQGTGWTLGAHENSNGSIIEYKTVSAGSVTATVTYSQSTSATQTGVSCWKP